MGTEQPLVRFYDLSGPKSWSPSCWCTRFVLNYKGVPYETVKLPYPGIKPACERLFPGQDDVQPTVPIIEILQSPHVALNNSTAIARLLNERFPETDGLKALRLVDDVDEYDASGGQFMKWVGAASENKLKKLMNLYGDDTFVKLLKKVEKYAY